MSVQVKEGRAETRVSLADYGCAGWPDAADGGPVPGVPLSSLDQRKAGRECRRDIEAADIRLKGS